MVQRLKRALTDAVLRRLAGEQTYSQGVEYFQHGHVQQHALSESGIEGEVRGRGNYTVSLLEDDGVLDYSCTCDSGSFCKHCVALGLTFLASGNATKRSRKSKRITLAEASDLLLNAETSVLVERMVAWAADDKEFRQKLLLLAASVAGGAPFTAEIKASVEQAARIRGYLSRSEAGRYVRKVQGAIEPIGDLLDTQPYAVMELCEAALAAIAKGMYHLPDANGSMQPSLDQLQAWHLDACRRARPEPKVLANRLFAGELNTGFDVFQKAALVYKDLLGREGIEEYRRLASTEWAKTHAYTAQSRYYEEPHGITSMMIAVAEAAGDFDGVIAAMSRNLSSSYKYLCIAQKLHEAGQRDRALEWAENGLREFPANTDPRLREFVVHEYRRRGRHEDRMALLWAAFRTRPLAPEYMALREHAMELGDWPRWKQKALKEARGRMDSLRFGSTPIVDLLAEEGDWEAAWQEAELGGCSEQLWLRLADAFAESQPARAARTYLGTVDIALTNYSGYSHEEAVDLLVKSAEAMRRLGQGEQFLKVFEAIMKKYRQKRNFVAEVERRKSEIFPVADTRKADPNYR